MKQIFYAITKDFILRVTFVVLSLHVSTSRLRVEPYHVMPFIANPTLERLL